MSTRDNHTSDKCPTSGIWQPANGGKQIALSEGDTFPPAKQEGTDYFLIQPTK